VNPLLSHQPEETDAQAEIEVQFAVQPIEIAAEERLDAARQSNSASLEPVQISEESSASTRSHAFFSMSLIKRHDQEKEAKLPHDRSAAMHFEITVLFMKRPAKLISRERSPFIKLLIGFEPPTCLASSTKMLNL
jgi:hypothetical protein